MDDCDRKRIPDSGFAGEMCMKTSLTKQPEHYLRGQYVRGKMGIYGCYEVSIGKWDSWAYDEHSEQVVQRKGYWEE